MAKLHCCTLQTQMANQSKINLVAIKGAIFHEGLEICAFLSLLRPIVAYLAESSKNRARPVVAAFRASVSPRRVGPPRANSASSPTSSPRQFTPRRFLPQAAGAGGQNPPRRSGAGAAEPAAVGVSVPATYGRVAPLSRTLGWVSLWGYLRTSAGGRPEPAAGAGGQKPPRRSGATAGDTPAVGAGGPRGRCAKHPSSETLGRGSAGRTLAEWAGGSPEPAAGAGGQKPPRRSGATAGDTPAVGAGGPRGRCAKHPSSETLGRGSAGRTLAEWAGGSPEPAAGAGGQKPPRNSGAGDEEPPAAGAGVARCPGAYRHCLEPWVGGRHGGSLAKPAGGSPGPAAGAGGQKLPRGSGWQPRVLRLFEPGARDVRAHSAALPRHRIGGRLGVV